MVQIANPFGSVQTQGSQDYRGLWVWCGPLRWVIRLAPLGGACTLTPTYIVCLINLYVIQVFMANLGT